MPQPGQKGTDTLSLIADLIVQHNLYLTGFSTSCRGGLNSDGVLLGNYVPQPVGDYFTSFGVTPTLTSQTTAANSATVNDISFQIGTSGWTIGDYWAVGSAKPFCGLKIKYDTASTQTAWVVAWQYWNGSAWTNIPATSYFLDSTLSAAIPFKAAAGTYFLTFAPPADWKSTTLADGGAGYTGYFIRQRTTTVPVGATIPLGSQIWTLSPGISGGAFGVPSAAQKTSVLRQATWNSLTTLSAANNDTKLLIANATTGGTYTLTLTKAKQNSADNAPLLYFQQGDQILVQQIQADGTTEFGTGLLSLGIGALS